MIFSSIFTSFIVPSLVLAHSVQNSGHLPRDLSSNHNLTQPNTIISELIKGNVIPEVVDYFEPQGSLEIEYSPSENVNLGNNLSEASTQHVPTVKYVPNSSEKEIITSEDRFILLMTDPDAPSRSEKYLSEYCHWIVTDVKLDQDIDGSYEVVFSGAKTLQPYLGPGPPENTGPHRYVFVLYRQDPNAHLVAPSERPRWGTDVAGSGVKEWIEMYGGDSELLTANFFYAEHGV